MSSVRKGHVRRSHAPTVGPVTLAPPGLKLTSGWLRAHRALQCSDGASVRWLGRPSPSTHATHAPSDLAGRRDKSAHIWQLSMELVKSDFGSHFGWAWRKTLGAQIPWHVDRRITLRLTAKEESKPLSRRSESAGLSFPSQPPSDSGSLEARGYLLGVGGGVLVALGSLLLELRYQVGHGRVAFGESELHGDEADIEA
jgi:hypothetical protein